MRRSLKTNPVTVLLSNEELQRLEAACETDDITMCEYIRRALKAHHAQQSTKRRGQNTLVANAIKRNQDGLDGKLSGSY